MNQKKTAFLSLVLTVAVTLSSVSFAFARVDEGMYTPDRIGSLWSMLKKRGMKIKPEEIYNPNGGGLSEAVIQLSVGCTAEFVSPEGLILTNHHCGFDAVSSASTPEKDLIELGFKADNRAGEIPAKDYSLNITQRVEDVTAKVRKGTENLSGDALAVALKKNSDELKTAEEAKAPKGSTIRIQSLNSGYFHYLYQMRQIKDVRVVYAPPRNIGVFGGDPDNFEWTRHTGDFTFLRAYTAPDGSAAEYSPNNVPMKVSKYLSANIGGLKEDDFVFVLGYPGSTTRYREASSIEFARDANYPFLWKWLQARSDAMKLIGETDEKKRLEFQSDIASFDNARKLYYGRAIQLRRAEVVQKRQAEEAQFTKWIAGDSARQQKYGSVLSEIAAMTAESNKYAKRDVVVRRIPDPQMAIFNQIYTAVNMSKPLPDSERAAKRAEIQKALQGREPVYEREMLIFFLRALADLPEGQKFDWVEQYFKDKGDRRSAEEAFARKIAEGSYWNTDTLMALYGPQTTEYRPERDDPRGFARALAHEKAAATARSTAFASKIDRLRLLYQQGMAEMKGVTPYPDANSSLRFSFGNVKGYSPREAEYRTPFTTLRGMIEKDTGINPFDVPQKIKDLNAARDFGRYAENGSVVVNFIATTDIIGGNSGSPIMNGKGEQVGIVFDGNFEGVGNDFFYNPALDRTIAVDIRYVLWVTEKVAGAKWIVDEMTLVGGRK